MSDDIEPPSDDDLERLLAFRDGLRRFLHWSEDQARGAGITGSQHQLLLVVRGHGGAPSIGDVAEHLLLRHHSAVELVDRAERAGLVTRQVDPDDHRVVRLHLTDVGDVKLRALSAAHLEELSRLRPSFESLWARLPDARGRQPGLPVRRPGGDGGAGGGGGGVASGRQRRQPAEGAQDEG